MCSSTETRVVSLFVDRVHYTVTWMGNLIRLWKKIESNLFPGWS